MRFVGREDIGAPRPVWQIGDGDEDANGERERLVWFGLLFEIVIMPMCIVHVYDETKNLALFCRNQSLPSLNDCLSSIQIDLINFGSALRIAGEE